MKIYPSLKKVPVTKMFQNIITAYAPSSQSFEERTPFIVYLTDGTEGIAVGSVHHLIDLMGDQSEYRIGKWNIVESDGAPTHLTTTCDFADIEVALVIEAVALYTSVHLDRKEDACCESDTL